MCSTLAVTSKVTSGNALVDGVDHAGRMVRAVEEIGIAEGDVAGPHVHELGDVGDDGVLGDQSGAPVVDHGDRAVTAPVRAPVARLHVAGQAAFGPEGHLCVAVQAGEEMAGGQAEASPPELDDGAVLPVVRRAGRGEGVDPGDEPGLVLSADGEVRHRRNPLGAVETGVQAVEAQRDVGPLRPDVPARQASKAHGGVHGHRARHRVRPRQHLEVEVVEGEIGAPHVVAGAQQRARR